MNEVAAGGTNPLIGAGLLPFVPPSVTAITKIVVVLGLVCQALGMQQIPPNIVSIPFKLMLFIAVDGWTQLIQELVLTSR